MYPRPPPRMARAEIRKMRQDFLPWGVGEVIRKTKQGSGRASGEGVIRKMRQAFAATRSPKGATQNETGFESGYAKRGREDTQNETEFHAR